MIMMMMADDNDDDDDDDDDYICGCVNPIITFVGGVILITHSLTAAATISWVADSPLSSCSNTHCCR